LQTVKSKAFDQMKAYAFISQQTCLLWSAIAKENITGWIFTALQKGISETFTMEEYYEFNK